MWRDPNEVLNQNGDIHVYTGVCLSYKHVDDDLTEISSANPLPIVDGSGNLMILVDAELQVLESNRHSGNLEFLSCDIISSRFYSLPQKASSCFIFPGLRA